MKSQTNQIKTDMTTTDPKRNAILDAMNRDIESHVNIADSALAEMERMNISPEEYKDINRRFGLNTYIAAYLRRIKESIADESLEKMESRMRFHVYQQRTKGRLDDKTEISGAQAAVAVCLEGYVERFFD